MVSRRTLMLLATDLKGPEGMKEIYIVLVFNKDSFFSTDKNEPIPVVWQVMPFKIDEPGDQGFSATYVSKYKVCKAKVDDKVVQVSTISETIQVGEKIDLVDDANPQFKYLDSFHLEGELAVRNKINEIVTIGLGSYDYDKFKPLAVWQDVPSNSQVSVDFTPRLEIFFSTHPYEKGEIFSESTYVLWRQNLAEPSLPPLQFMSLAWDPDKERFFLKVIKT